MAEIKEKLEDLIAARRRILDDPGSASETSGTRNPVKPTEQKKKKKKKKRKENIGVGRPDTSALDAGIARVRAKQALTSDPAKKAELEARIEAMKANQ